VRQGNRVWIESAWREKNTMAAIGEFIARLNKLKQKIGLKPHEVEGDADGMGIVFCQALADAGWPVLHFHGAAKPMVNSEYKNRIAEVWTEGTIGIRKREWILEADEETKAQVINRKSGRDMKGLLTIESKEDMAKRGVESPDRADALLGAMGPLPMSFNIGGSEEFQQNLLEQAHNQGGMNELPGAWTG
jgi:phage terminase large subunit